MALGRQGERQADLMIGWAELPRSPGHAFYDRLQAILVEAGFYRFAEAQCRPFYAAKRGRPSLPPGRYFPMRLVGYFEGIDSEPCLEGWSAPAAGALFPGAPGRFVRGPGQRGRPRVARRRQPAPARVPAPGPDRAGARPLLAQQDPRPAAAGGARGGVRPGAAALGRAR